MQIPVLQDIILNFLIKCDALFPGLLEGISWSLQENEPAWNQSNILVDGIVIMTRLAARKTRERKVSKYAPQTVSSLLVRAVWTCPVPSKMTTSCVSEISEHPGGRRTDETVSPYFPIYFFFSALCLRWRVFFFSTSTWFQKI